MASKKKSNKRTLEKFKDLEIIPLGDLSSFEDDEEIKVLNLNLNYLLK